MEQRLAPRDLTRYLVAAFRNRARRRHRDSLRRENRDAAGYAEVGGAHQSVIAECVSEYTLSVTDASETRDRSVISGLAERVASELDASEMTMMIGIGRHMPLREIAEQVGITYGAARVRVHRLRERFRGIASTYLATLEPEQKKELSRFFRRAELELPSRPVNQRAQRALREPSQ
jgi:DNA-directed RNA polymerase specialized sigma24 family protein